MFRHGKRKGKPKKPSAAGQASSPPPVASAVSAAATSARRVSGSPAEVQSLCASPDSCASPDKKKKKHSDQRDKSDCSQDLVSRPESLPDDPVLPSSPQGQGLSFSVANLSPALEGSLRLDPELSSPPRPRSSVAHPEDRFGSWSNDDDDEDSDDDDDDDEATVATSNLTGIDSCENVPAQLDDGDDDDDVTPASEDDIADGIDGDTYDGGAPVYRDCPNNLQSVHTAPLLAFGLAPTITDDIRQIETNNLQQSQDIEGLPLVPKRKRRRKRKRKRPRRRKGQANKPRPKHSPVTPPRRHTNVRRQAAKTHESLIKEFQAYFYSDAAKYCPASGFDTKWHRKGIG
mmetsp:Transcript_11573/g.25148  ORF Transcript_11573/g.25148 Transcript_11573/m.25148 type:complete len:345 (-) Transcript_11573:414-1448(-)